MDIKQMKTFVSEELKGLKQEHRLLSLRKFEQQTRRGNLIKRVLTAVLITDIGASESIMKKKTKQDFQELLQKEHCESGFFLL